MNPPQNTVLNDSFLITEPPILSERTEQIVFRERPIYIARLSDNQSYVVLRSLADAFGISRVSQVNRLKRKESFFAQYVCKVLMNTRGGPQSHACMNASAVPLFLTTTSLDAVKDPLDRNWLQLFIQESLQILAENYEITRPGELREIRNNLARLVLEHEAKKKWTFGADLSNDGSGNITSGRINEDNQVYEIRRMLHELRGHDVLPDDDAWHRHLSPEQVKQINKSIDYLGFLLEKQGLVNPYNRICNNIFRMTGVGIVERIYQKDFEKVMNWIENQIKSLHAAEDNPYLIDKINKQGMGDNHDWYFEDDTPGIK